MKNWQPAPALLLVILLLAACGGAAAVDPIPSRVATAGAATIPATDSPSAGPVGAATPASRPTARPAATPLATRPGADYVRLLPREAAVPADWAMNPIPDYETRQPGPGETYRFACRELTARSVGAASVGYRHLEGLPSIHIEYVIYPTAEDATAALADMQGAVEACPTFTIGAGESATAAAFVPLEFPAYGDAAFAASLNTTADVTGELQTHMIKIRNGHVVIGINHTAYAGGPPPDAALTESLAALAASNLDSGPAAPGRD